MPVVELDPREHWVLPRRGCALRGAGLVGGIALAALIVWLTRSAWLTAMARFLAIGQAPRRAEALIVLSGGPGDRARYGAQLFAEGYAPIVLTAGEPHVPGTPAFDAQYEMGRLESFGIPAENIATLGVVGSTIEEAQRSRDWLLVRGGRSLIVVSDPYHLRRVSLIYENVYRGSGVDLIYVATQPSWFSPEGWWQRDADFDAVVSEYIKMVNTLSSFN